MKVYFGFTVAGNRSSVEAAKKIVGILESMGHEVLTSHLLGEDPREADRRLPPQDVFARDMRWLALCDIFIAEVSGSSFGLGFEAGYLLGATPKKAILFYDCAVNILLDAGDDRLSLAVISFIHQASSEKHRREAETAGTAALRAVVRRSDCRRSAARPGDLEIAGTARSIATHVVCFEVLD
jgi:hypothetical protein